MTTPEDDLALKIDDYLKSCRWIAPACLAGIAINLYAATCDLLYPMGWYSYLFGALSIGCAGLCLWAWRGHRALARLLKERA